MGTSSSRGGPTDRSKLLPSWAQTGDTGAPDADDEGEAEGEGDAIGPSSSSNDDDREVDTDDPDSDRETDADGDSDGDGDDDGASAPLADDRPSVPVPSGSRWQAAKGALTRAAKAGGRQRAERIRTAAAAHVRARGGARSAAAAATSGRTAAARVGGFLGTLASSGLGEALRSLNLGDYVGRGVEEVFAAIANALAPDGALVEEAAARAAVDQVLCDLYDTVEAAGGDLAALDAMDAEDVIAGVEECIGAYVYERWVGELGLSIEKGAVSEETAVGLEQGMRDYVREAVRLERGDRDPLSIDWAAEGPAIADRVFRDAYSFLEGGA